MYNIKMPEDMTATRKKYHGDIHDPLEQRIRRLIQDQACSTEQGRIMFDRARELQTTYYQDCLQKLDDEQYIHERTQKLLNELADIFHPRIVDGEDYLGQLPEGKPVFVVLNHYSGHKLSTVFSKDIGVRAVDLEGKEMEEIYPPPLHYAPVKPIADRLGARLYDSHIELPNENLVKIQHAAGGVVIPPKEGIFRQVVEQSQKFVENHPNDILVNFPEGESSGKRNQGGPYDMVPFHKGAFVIASQLGATILPVAMFFNPESGFELGVFKPFVPDPKTEDREASNEYFESVAESTRKTMQDWLDQRKPPLSLDQTNG